LTYALCVEELARGWMSVSGVINTHFIVAYMLRQHGTDAQKQKYLPRMATGEARGAFSMSEPELGSDVAAIRTRAKRNADGTYTIDGQKMWLTNGGSSTLVAALVRTDEGADKPHRNLTAFLVEKPTGFGEVVPGLTIPGKIDKLGYKGIDTTELIFDGYVAGADDILGGAPGQGFFQMMDGVEVGRVNVSARACGVGIRAFELAVRYAQQRHTFGKPIADHQAIAFQLAEMATKVEAAHLMMVNAARLKDSGERNDVAAGMAKYLASEFCSEVTQQSFRIHGGYGYSKEYEIERLMRDAPFRDPEEHHQQATARRLSDMTVSAPDFAPRPQLAEDVARFVRRRIFDGTYAAGQYIRLDQLAVELGVSVTPVREALFVLSAEGLLSQQPRRGFVVVPVTGRDVTDVSNVQAHIGGELAARAAVNITDDQLRELEKIQTELEDAYASDDDERAVRLNHEFHKAINVASDSPKLAQLMSQITRYAPESVFPTIAGWPDQSTEHHRKLLAALEKHDEDLARAAMSEHLAAGAAPLIEHLTQRGVVD
jgi:alkylation response protein AidB-like acyl-CoA dehydrogenase/DNA-binding GntR family transcriptional regulator